MTSHRAPAKHLLQSKAEQLSEDEILGIQPWQKDSPRRRKVIIGALALTVVGSVVGTTALFWPKSKPEVFEDSVNLDGHVVDCGFVVANYEPDDTLDQQIAGGASAIYRGVGSREGEKFYASHIDAAVAGACDSYLMTDQHNTETPMFVVGAATEPYGDQAGSFRIVVELEPVGGHIQARN